MPLLRLRLEFTNGIAQCNLKVGSVPAQPLTLKESIVKLSGADTGEYLVIELPFLQSFDINTNSEVDGIPIYTNATTLHRNIHDIRFMPSSDIPQEFEVKCYQDNLTSVYTTRDAVIDLLFEYNRAGLF